MDSYDRSPGGRGGVGVPHGHALIAVPLDGNGQPIWNQMTHHQMLQYNGYGQGDWANREFIGPHAFSNAHLDTRAAAFVHGGDFSEQMGQLNIGSGAMSSASNISFNGGRKQKAGEKRSEKRPNEQRGPLVEEKLRRTIYISNIPTTATENQLATYFQEKAGPISDVRSCGESGSKFAFIEFCSIETVAVALELNGSLFFGSPLKVLQSKTAILSVDSELVPRSQDDIERCKRTVYVSNIEKRMEKEDVRRFFEGTCGPISNMRLLGDNAHATRIAFVEFRSSDGAMAALNCSGAILGTLAIRISPSKTPLRPDPSTQVASSPEDLANDQKEKQQFKSEDPTQE